MMSRITLNLRKNMDMSNTANTKYSTIEDIRLENLAAPPKAMLHPARLGRREAVGSV